MKFFNHVLLLFAILCSIPTQAESLRPNVQKNLFYHLTEVNQEWNNQQDLEQLDLRQMIHFQNDNQRIQTHLKLVCQLLSNRSMTHLTEEQRANRQRHLAVLKSYYETAVFPTNHYHTKRQPYFVDNYNVHCAVGYLLQQDKQTNLVTIIRENDNYAYIQELTKYPQLEIWAKANGFMVDELAWIQPTYGPSNEFSPVGTGVDGEVLCFIKSDDDETLFVGGNFTTINGVYSPSIAAYDGTNFTAISGFIGTVYDMKYYGGKLYAAGEFIMPQTQDAVNIAVWDGTTWTPLQNGNMFGAIYAIEILRNKLYIGGNFQRVNNFNNMKYLAHYNLSTEQWSKSGNISNGNSVPLSAGFTVDSTVYDLEIIEGKLLVAGAFTEVAPTITNPYFNKFTTSQMAFWDGYRMQWLSGFSGQYGTVRCVKSYDGRLYVGSEITNQFYDISVLSLGFSYNGNVPNYSDNLVHNFFQFNNKVYALGGIDMAGSVNWGKGMVEVIVSGTYIGFSGATFTDNSIKCAVEFKGKAYFGGGFTTVSNGYNYDTPVVVNGLMQSRMDLPPTSTQIIDAENISKVWYANSMIIIEKDDYESVDFTLFNVNGQVVHSTQNINTNRHEIAISHLPKGVYFYKMNGEKDAMSGKLAVY